MASVTRDAQMAWVAFAVAILGLIASVMLLVMFATEVPYDGPYVFGAGYEVLTAVTNALTAALIMHLSHFAGPSAGEKVLTPVLAVLLIVGAGSGILLVAHVVSYTISVAVSIMVLFLQGVWLFWFNRQMHRRQLLPRGVSTFGWLIGLAVMVGLVFGTLGLLLPPLHIAQLLILGFGVFAAGGGWLIVPVWWVMVGVWLLRGGRPARGAERPGLDGATDGENGPNEPTATVKQRGRRKA